MCFARIRQHLSRLSIQKKLIFINLAATTTALFFAVVMAIYGEYTSSRNAIIDSLLTQAKIVGNNTTAALVFDDQKGAEDILRAFSESRDVRAAIIYDVKGHKLAEFIKQDTESGDGDISSLDASASTIHTYNFTENISFMLDNNINVVHDIKFENETIGRLFIQADVS